MEDREDSATGPSQRTYLAESSVETSAERSQRLATLTMKKANGSQSTIEVKRARTEQQRVQK